MDQVHVIRHQVLVEGRSQRSVAREHGVSRNTTVRKYMDQSPPRRVESKPRRRWVRWSRFFGQFQGRAKVYSIG